MICYRNINNKKISEYLKLKSFPSPVSLILYFGILYHFLMGSEKWRVFLLIIIGITWLIRVPRWVTYCLFFVLLIIHLFLFVHGISNQQHDLRGTRDDCVELTTKAFINGLNPWNEEIANQLNAPLTTGPASILLAYPIVKIFHKINWLTFFFWISFFVILLYCDLKHQNSTFVPLVLFFLTGIFFIEYTLYWSLEELYYPFIFFTASYWFYSRGYSFLTGLFLIIPMLSRLNYIFLIFAFLLWCFLNTKIKTNDFLKLSIGSGLGILLLLTPFLWVGGKDFIEHNAFTIALSYGELISKWSENNFIFTILNFIQNKMEPFMLKWLKTGFTIIFILIIALRMKRINHPFWHLSVAGFITHIIAYYNSLLFRDYGLIFILPAMLAIAFSNREQLYHIELV